MAPRTLHLGMFMFDEMTQLDLTGPYEVFQRVPSMQIHLASRDGDPVTAEGGMRIAADTDIGSLPPLQIIFVPGGFGVNAVMEDPRMLDVIRRQGMQAEYVTSVCTGSLVLGAAGLLRGYKATTHWMSHHLLHKFGAVPDPARTVVDRNRFTGGGVTAGIDLALRIVGELHGKETAERIQLMIEYNPDPPFDAGSPDRADPAVVKEARAKASSRMAEREAIVERITGNLQS